MTHRTSHRFQARRTLRRSLATLATTALAAGLVGHAAAPASAATRPRIRAQHALGAKYPTHLVKAHVTASNATAATALPASVDLSPWASAVGNQGDVGSCVSWAIGRDMVGWYANHDGKAGQPFAPMFVYSQINHGVDNGSNPVDALALLEDQGIDTQAHYSHSSTDWQDQPNASERANAQHYRARSVHTLFAGSNQGAAAQQLIQSALASGHPVALEIPVRPGFDNMGSTASAVDTDTSGASRGYHEILALGYNSAGVLIQNSWGTGWGFAASTVAGSMRGFGRLGWNIVQKDVAEADTIDGFGLAHDMTSDSANDLLARSSSGTLYTYTGNGAGAFKSSFQVGTGFNYFDTMLVTPDFTGNGTTDLIGRAAADGSLWLYDGNGSGGYANPVQIGSGWNVFTSLVAPGDFNGDGRADLIGRTSDGVLWFYAGDGAGGYANPVQIGHGWNIFDTILGVGDFNGDGHADLVARKPDGTLWLYRGNGAGGFLSGYPQIGTGWNVFTALAAPRDFNGDGTPDLVGRKADGTLWLYRGNGSGGFFSPYPQIGSGWNGMNLIG